MKSLKVVCIIPFFNEEKFLGLTLESILEQTRLPHRIVLVDDGSSDGSPAIAKKYQSRFPDLIRVIKNEKSDTHLPGGKVVRAFNAGFRSLKDEFDIFCKLDADLIFPKTYFERLLNEFDTNDRLGIAGGVCVIEKRGGWITENVADKDHVRGALKAYRNECFQAIGGLREGMGWDTLDELLAVFHGFGVKSLPDLEVKHLKPTGASYSSRSKYFKGLALYRMGYGFVLTSIAAFKLAKSERSLIRFLHHMTGFFKGQFSSTDKMVNAEEESFIRRYRWQRIKGKLQS
jgi:glycosyltransferase involved in cell wall biosynthesis